MALIHGKSDIVAEDVLKELLETVVKESEKRRSLALISVSDCPLLATQLPQVRDDMCDCFLWFVHLAPFY